MLQERSKNLSVRNKTISARTVDHKDKKIIKLEGIYQEWQFKTI